MNYMDMNLKINCKNVKNVFFLYFAEKSVLSSFLKYCVFVGFFGGWIQK
jgi:hypothetical protein